MPLNTNPQVVRLLSWHGHDRGGVRVPFQQGANPYGETIETPLITRLRALARAIAEGDASAPRWIFLVGGPGNGKSETVQDFLSQLDLELGLSGELVRVLTARFNNSNLVPRRVTVTPADLPSSAARFSSRLERLVIVQDATATDHADSDAAHELARDVSDLYTNPGSPPALFVVCANRGLLSRAIREAHRFWNAETAIGQLFVEVIRATSLGSEALNEQPDCWPLKSDERVACWPLDVESLLADNGSGPSPFTRMFTRATDSAEWEVPTRCLDCNSRHLCPLRQNAEWLRSDAEREALQKILRRGELKAGQRWNFRNLYSLAAEMMVGQWGDFQGHDHPCNWVHGHVRDASVSPEGARSVFPLVDRLFPHALFAKQHVKPAAEAIRNSDVILGRHRQSDAVIAHLASDAAGTAKPIRQLLLKNYAGLDPALETPRDTTQPLRLIEDRFSQSVDLGKGGQWHSSLTRVEQLALDILQAAEQEWDLLARDAPRSRRVVEMLRRVAAILVKRSVGTRLGHHALESYLVDYEKSLHDQRQLNLVQETLLRLLGQHRFNFNLVESFGQPKADGNRQSLVTLEGSSAGVKPRIAPTATATRPGHDLPRFVIGGKSTIPVTFDFYLALRLRKEGCAGSSLPASVRAALDRVNQAHAGSLFANKEAFASGVARVVLDGGSSISLPDETSDPVLQAE